MNHIMLCNFLTSVIELDFLSVKCGTLLQYGSQSVSQFILYNSNDDKYTTKGSKINELLDELQ